MKLLLTERMLSTIREIIAARMPNGAELVERLTDGGALKSEREEVINLIAIELCEKGFDAESEPTAYGLELEHLIDTLNRPNLK